MTDFQTVAKASEIAPGTMKLVNLGGKAVVIANVEGTFYAFGNQCTHVGGPLAEGALEGKTVTCPWHATIFNIESGEPLEGPGADPIPIYQVRVESGDIQITES
ncbi:MAG: Rieske 2Fe-2S domain-containing protein [Proteobacteria bacterium]|nr:Rieske 2Fe-2S domain-containing protein [Pseudomonadota bacterium]